MDTELVAVDRAQGNKLLAFQTLSTRGRYVGRKGGKLGAQVPKRTTNSINQPSLPPSLLHYSKDVTAEGVTVQICVFAFDLLFFNGQSHLKEALSSRRALLYSLFKPVVEEKEGGKEGEKEGGFEGRFEFATHVETSDPERVQEFFTEALEAGCEGIMVRRGRREGGREGGRKGREGFKGSVIFLCFDFSFPLLPRSLLSL